jgi:hypothetical protein
MCVGQLAWTCSTVPWDRSSFESTRCCDIIGFAVMNQKGKGDLFGPPEAGAEVRAGGSKLTSRYVRNFGARLFVSGCSIPPCLVPVLERAHVTIHDLSL